MNKRHLLRGALLVVVVVSGLLLTGCAAVAEGSRAGGWGQGAAQVDGAGTGMVDLAVALDADEIADLIFMREEEKLAHDVYMALYETWGQQIFSNIASSEQTHTDAVARLLERFGIEDPVVSAELGVFADAGLQSLYDQLVAQGQTSLEDALRVGIAIEELDIVDLEERLERTDNTEIERVYTSLLKGSYNHLAAFVSTLERQTGEAVVSGFLQDAPSTVASGGSQSRGRGRGRR